MNDRDKIRDLVVAGPSCQTYKQVVFISRQIETNADSRTPGDPYLHTPDPAHHTPQTPTSGLSSSVRARILNPTHRSTR